MTTPVFPTPPSLAPVGFQPVLFDPTVSVPSRPTLLVEPITDAPALQQPFSSAPVFEPTLFEPSNTIDKPSMIITDAPFTVATEAPVFKPSAFAPIDLTEAPVFQPSRPEHLNWIPSGLSLGACADRDIQDICRFNNNRCCTERVSAAVIVPPTTTVLCYEARASFGNNDSSLWTDEECNQVRSDVERLGGFGCACTTLESQRNLTCAERDFRVCDFEAPSSFIDCCSVDASLLITLPSDATLVVKCDVANQTLHGSDSISWSDGQCEAVQDAIRDHAQLKQCTCAVASQFDATINKTVVALTNPPTPSPTPPPVRPNPTAAPSRAATAEPDSIDDTNSSSGVTMSSMTRRDVVQIMVANTVLLLLLLG